VKTPQHSTAPKRVTKKQARKELDSQLSMYCVDRADWPITEDMLVTYGRDLLMMIDEDKHMVDFQAWKRKHRLTKGQIDHYLPKYPKFKAYWDEAKDQLGWRIFKRGWLKQADASLTRFVLPYYSDDFKSLEEYRTHLKTVVAEAQKPTLTVVEMPRFQSSGLVPDKIEIEKEKNEGR